MAATRTIRVGRDLDERVKAAAGAEGITPSEWIRRALVDCLDGRTGDIEERLEDVERRLAEIERMASAR